MKMCEDLSLMMTNMSRRNKLILSFSHYVQSTIIEIHTPSMLLWINFRGISSILDFLVPNASEFFFSPAGPVCCLYPSP